VDKDTVLWSVGDLASRYSAINFPEYQREPNVWSRAAKQRLIDSMVRQFDIASIYLYVDQDGSIDCIDGRQRIGAIMSFLASNPDHEDDGFEYRILNEIFDDEGHPFAALDGKRFADLAAVTGQDSLAATFVTAFRGYSLTIVQLRGSRRPEEFNLQFTRLNLGTIINSGEKLHAMVGELRDVCFGEQGLGQHAFFRGTRIPTRRYSKEQVAAQLLAQVLSLEETGEYTRTRHFDLQRAFKEHAKLTTAEGALVTKTRHLLDLLEAAFDELQVLRNRAITVSTILLAWEQNVSTRQAADQIARFVDGFTCRLQWQVKKGLDVDDEYRYLIEFQRHLTQASVEKPAVAARAKVLREELERWRQVGGYRGDEDYRSRTGADAGEACKAM
jgi:hypothetical protein